jgi:nitroreductase
MANKTLDLIHARRSVCAFQEQPLSRSEKDTILEAAMRAPTAGNMMLFSILEVEEQKLKDQLVVTCDNQPFIARSSFVLIFLTILIIVRRKHAVLSWGDSREAPRREISYWRAPMR